MFAAISSIFVQSGEAKQTGRFERGGLFLFRLESRERSKPGGITAPPQGGGTSKSLQILRAGKSSTSLCRGTVDDYLV